MLTTCRLPDIVTVEQAQALFGATRILSYLVVDCKSVGKARSRRRAIRAILPPFHTQPATVAPPIPVRLL